MFNNDNLKLKLDQISNVLILQVQMRLNFNFTIEFKEKIVVFKLYFKNKYITLNTKLIYV